jgi:hypothetical protein
MSLKKPVNWDSHASALNARMTMVDSALVGFARLVGFC